MASSEPTWVWTSEVMRLVRWRMRSDGLSASDLAQRAEERLGVSAEGFERRLRALQESRGVMGVHTADRLLVLVGCHLTDVPCYSAAIFGELPPDRWPRRGSAEAPPAMAAAG